MISRSRSLPAFRTLLVTRLRGLDVRRCLVNRFPFGVIYSVEQGEIFILAVMHLRRHPDYWKDRLQEILQAER